MDLRNPFGLKDGQIVMIEDIPQSMNGQRCGCVCPACKDIFEARMGEIRRHHFAHSGKGCSETNAYIAGLYMLLNEYLSSGQQLYMPPVIVQFDLSANYYLDETNVRDHIRLISRSKDEKREIVLYTSKYVQFTASKIMTNSDNKPVALLAAVAEKRLAIRITPPDTVCKRSSVSQYEDYPTLEIDLSDEGERIQNSPKSELFKYFMNTHGIYHWIYNPIIEEAFSRVIMRSKAYYDAAQARIKKETEERLAGEKRLEEARKAAEAAIQAAEARRLEKQRIAAEAKKAKAEQEKRDEARRIHEETGGYITGKIGSRYITKTLDEITEKRPYSNILIEFSRSNFEKAINDIREYKQAGVSMLYTKMCFISPAETAILLQIYDELKSTEPETAEVLEYLMDKSCIVYK